MERQMKRAGSILLAVFALVLASTPARAALQDYFVSTEWLAQNRQEIVVLDARVLPLYMIGHIEGAFHMDKSKFLFKRDGVKSLVPTAGEFEVLMDSYGITPDTTVVVYTDDKNPYSARLVWTLRYHGHEKVFVLDGGYERWAKEERATALLPTYPDSVKGYKVAGGQDVRAEAGYILTRLLNPATVVWDTRREAEYDGSEVRADRGGHIPGAVHLNWVNLQKEVDGVKVLKSEQEIVSLLAAHGILPDREIVSHCQTGIRSSYATLVLLGLGYQARNYDGSWIEWANSGYLPVEKPVKVAGN